MKRNELEIIKQAIINEIESYEFYRMAIKDFENPQVKTVLTEFMNEEKDHVMWLEELFAKMKESHNDDIVLSSIPSPKPDKPFQFDVSKLKNLSSLMSVYSIGMELEGKATQFYLEQEILAEDEDAQRLYKILASWEKTHYNMFYKMYESLKDEWWSQQNYAPF